MKRILVTAALLGFIGGVLMPTAQAATNNPGAKPAVTTVQPHWPPVTEKECTAPQTSPTHGPKPPAVPITVQGIPGADLSQYEGQVDWTKLAAGEKFVIVRFSHGAHIDTEYANYWPAAKKAGVIRGVYTYLDPLDAHPFADQVRAFVNGVKLGKGDLAPILDVENPCLYLHMTVAERIAFIQKWADVFEKVYGVKPILYMSPSFVDRALGGAAQAAALAQYPLWIANYHSAKPIVPLPWTTYIIWQYAEDAPLPGVSIPADGDIAPGTIADLRKYTLRRKAGGNTRILSKHDLDDSSWKKQGK
jgi:lysozyme